MKSEDKTDGRLTASALGKVIPIRRAMSLVVKSAIYGDTLCLFTVAELKTAAAELAEGVETEALEKWGQLQRVRQEGYYDQMTGLLLEMLAVPSRLPLVRVLAELRKRLPGAMG